MGELMLDGNAIAGLLQEVFAVEMTTAIGTCAGCGAAGPAGAVHVRSSLSVGSSACRRAAVSRSKPAVYLCVRAWP